MEWLVPSPGQLGYKPDQGDWVSGLVMVDEAISNKLQCCAGVAQGWRCDGWGGLELVLCCWFEQVLHQVLAVLCICVPDPGESRKSPGGDQENQHFVFLFLDLISFFFTSFDPKKMNSNLRHPALPVQWLYR